MDLANGRMAIPKEDPHSASLLPFGSVGLHIIPRTAQLALPRYGISPHSPRFLKGMSRLQREPPPIGFETFFAKLEQDLERRELWVSTEV